MTNLRLSPQEAARELLSRRQARRHLLHFTNYTYPQYQAEQFHRFLADTLTDVVNGDIRRLMIFAPPQHGKLIADNTPILTPDGWTRHGALQVGDFVFGRDGKPVRVLAIGEKGVADRNVLFSDGTWIACHPKHEWIVSVRDGHRPHEGIWETEAMEDRGTWIGPRGKRGGRGRFQVDSNVPIEMPPKELPIPPYALGVWLGDGTTNKNCVTHHPGDMAIVDKMEGLGIVCTAHSVHKITGAHTSYFRSMYRLLIDNDLMGHKHIPSDYLCSSVIQRLELLAGLIDTDGYVYKKTGRVTFSSCSWELVQDVCRLVVSLGWRPTKSWTEPSVSSSGIVGRKAVCQVTFNPTLKIPVALKRKRCTKLNPAKRKRSIERIERIDSQKGCCIQVEGGVYLVGETLIPTHNSELASVRLPAFWLGNRPDDPAILTSYAASLAHNKSRQARSVVESLEFRALFPEIKTDRSSRAVDHWELDGYRGGLLAAGVGGPITGHGGMLGVVDDPLENWAQAQSKTIRDSVWEWYRSTFRTRIWENGAIVLIQTRWHEDDLAGRLLKAQPGEWKVLRLSAIAEPQAVRDDNNKRLGLRAGLPDPLGRKKGKPLCPGRFSKKALKGIQRDVGDYVFTSQYQGSPRPPSGNRIKRAHLPIRPTVPATPDEIVRYWDKAATQEGGAYTSGVLVARFGREYGVLSVVRGQWSTWDREETIKQTAQLDRQMYGPQVNTWIEQEPGSGGKDSALMTITNLSGFSIFAERATGSKEVRAGPFIAQCQGGNVWLLEAAWNYEYIEELIAFPNSTYKDQMDSSSGSFNKVALLPSADVIVVNL